MSDHEWCRDTARDEAVRAAEAAAAEWRLLRLGEVVLAEDEFQTEDWPWQRWRAVPAVCVGSVIEDQSLPHRRRIDRPIQHRDLPEVVAALTERVARLEAAQATIGTGDVFADVQCGSTADEIARLTAERDAARAECERLRACADPFGEELAVIAAWERCAITADWPADEPETAVRCAASMEREIVRLRARVAELEAAPAANAGGEQQEPVAWGVRWHGEKNIDFEFVYSCKESASAVATAEGNNGTVVPLFAAPVAESATTQPPPRGWLTAEERNLIAGLTDDDHFTEEGQNIAKALLARETPPRVKVPNRNVIAATAGSRDIMWIAAIREAGGEVEG